MTAGFSNSAAGTVIPNAFFARVLPEISDPAELVVSTYVFFALGVHKRRARFVTLAELAADNGLARALSSLAGEGALERGLSLAVARGTLVRANLRANQTEREEVLYTANIPANVRALERLAVEGIARGTAAAGRRTRGSREHLRALRREHRQHHPASRR